MRCNATKAKTVTREAITEEEVVEAVVKAGDVATTVVEVKAVVVEDAEVVVQRTTPRETKFTLLPCRTKTIFQPSHPPPSIAFPS